MNKENNNNKENKVEDVNLEMISTSIGINIINMNNYLEYSLATLELSEKDLKYIDLLKGFQIFVNNFNESLQNILENRKEEGIKFNLEIK